MEIRLDNRKLKGSLKIIPSKSFAHRAVIGAFLSRLTSGSETEVIIGEKSQDIEATIRVTEGLSPVSYTHL